MNRELKFRAWDESRKEMITEFGLLKENMPQLLQNEEDGYIFCGHSQDNGDWLEPILMQYTGLKDKNGKEIYEGDVIRQSSDLCIIEYCVGGFDCQMLVELKNGGTLRGSVYNFSFLSEKYCEIIGNIYENPELLTQ